MTLTTFCQQLAEVKDFLLDDVIALIQGNVFFTVDELLARKLDKKGYKKYCKEIQSLENKTLNGVLKFTDEREYLEEVDKVLIIIDLLSFAKSIPKELIVLKLQDKHGIFITKDGIGLV